jgi:sterol desaturase/sphingolipid hydroxylase (fatty acid hydroxylase superfamily)
LLLAFAISLQLLLQHSNVDMTPGLLSHVFAWAPVHRLHHMKYGAAGNVNFGLFFNLWDRLLGTALHAGAYSIRQGELGIGNRADFPQGYVEQLLEPFRPEQFTDEPQVPEALRR